MRPVSHQPGKLYKTAKTDKFSSLGDIPVDNLKLCPVISQIGAYTYNSLKVMSRYLKPLGENECKISETSTFTLLIKGQTRLNFDEEYFSYDVDDLLIFLLRRVWVISPTKYAIKTNFHKFALKLFLECSC